VAQQHPRLLRLHPRLLRLHLLRLHLLRPHRQAALGKGLR
jgi:hypothetical protein